MLGVSEATVNRDVSPVTNVTNQKPNLLESKEKNNQDVTNVTTPSPITQSPFNVWNDQEKKASSGGGTRSLP